jgi:hypothetical protein
MTHHLPRPALVLGVAGAAAGIPLAMVGLVAAPAAAVPAAMVGGLVAAGIAMRLGDRPGSDIPARRRAMARAGGTAGGLWLAGTGVVVLLGASTASVLVALLVVGVPAAVLGWRSVRPVELAAAAAPVTVQAPAPAPAALSTAELCLAWRRSYLELGELPAGPARDELVTHRQSMLDELERRDPAGFRRWLEAGARAGGDPGRYLATGPGA